MRSTNQGSKDARHPFTQAMDRGSDGIVSVGNGWAHGAGAVVGLIGNFLAEILIAIGKPLGNIPGAGKTLRGFFNWLGSIVSAGFEFVNLLLSCAISLLAHAISGTLRILGGVVSAITVRDTYLLRKGALDFLSPLAGSFITLLVKGVAFIQSVIFMQLGERPLNEQEKETIRRVYRNSLAIGNIRVIEGFAGLFSTNDRPFTLGDRIYLKHVDTAKDPGLFTHECCHVWQYQQYGARYVIEALWAQYRVPDAYNWEKEIERGKTHWQDFNREAQAQFIQDSFNGGRKIPVEHIAGEFYSDDPVGQNVEYKRKGVDYTDLAKQTIASIRNKGRG